MIFIYAVERYFEAQLGRDNDLASVLITRVKLNRAATSHLNSYEIINICLLI